MPTTDIGFDVGGGRLVNSHPPPLSCLAPHAGLRGARRDGPGGLCPRITDPAAARW